MCLGAVSPIRLSDFARPLLGSSLKVVNFSMNERPPSGQLLGYRTQGWLQIRGEQHTGLFLGGGNRKPRVNRHGEAAEGGPARGLAVQECFPEVMSFRE